MFSFNLVRLFSSSHKENVLPILQLPHFGCLGGTLLPFLSTASNLTREMVWISACWGSNLTAFLFNVPFYVQKLILGEACAIALHDILTVNSTHELFWKKCVCDWLDFELFESPKRDDGLFWQDCAEQRKKQIMHANNKCQLCTTVQKFGVCKIILFIFILFLFVYF